MLSVHISKIKTSMRAVFDKLSTGRFLLSAHDPVKSGVEAVDAVDGTCHNYYSDDYDHNAGVQGLNADCRKAQFQPGVHS
jgi:hypothetical protein